MIRQQWLLYLPFFGRNIPYLSPAEYGVRFMAGSFSWCSEYFPLNPTGGREFKGDWRCQISRVRSCRHVEGGCGPMARSGVVLLCMRVVCDGEDVTGIVTVTVAVPTMTEAINVSLRDDIWRGH